MSKCCIVQCSSIARRSNLELTLYRIPHDDTRRKKWLDAIGIENIHTEYKVWYVCSLHFDLSSFNKTIAKRIKRDAVPSLWLLKPPTRNVNINIKLEGGQIVIDPSPAKNPVPVKLGVRHPILAAEDDVFNKVVRQELDHQYLPQKEFNIVHLIALSEKKMCRACFATNCRLYSMRVDKKLRGAYEILTGVSVEDNIPPYLCALCSTLLLKCVAFRTKSLKGHQTLQGIAEKHKFVTQSVVKSLYEKQNEDSTLSITLYEPNKFDLEVLEVSTEEQDNNGPTVVVDSVKSESDDIEMVDNFEDGVEPEMKQDETGDDCFNGESLETSSEPTRQLRSNMTPVPKNPRNALVKPKPKINVLKPQDLSISLRNGKTVPQLTKERTKSRTVLSKEPYIKHFPSETWFTTTKMTIKEQVAERQKVKSAIYRNYPYKCTECYRGFLDADTFDSHMLRHSDKIGKYKCEVCKLRYKWASKLKLHMDIQHTYRFTCNVCPYVTTFVHSAYQHEQMHMGIKHKCPHCGKEFLKLTTYKSHVRIQHPTDVVCFICGYCFMSKSGLKQHQNLKHRLLKDRVPEDGPYCKECDVTFASQEAFDAHLGVSAKHRTDDRRNSRPQRRAPNYVYNKNESEKKSIGPIPCEQCGVQLKDMYKYTSHFKTEHPDKNRTSFPSTKRPCMCEVCGKIFQTLNKLKDHHLLHKGDPIPCEVCGKRYKTRYSLAMHRKRHDHTARSSYQCPVCGRNFASTDNRSRHMFTHTGLRPYKCEVCGKAFNNKYAKQAHVMYVHMKKPWPKRNRDRRKKVAQEDLEPMKSEEEVEYDEEGNYDEEVVILYEEVEI